MNDQPDLYDEARGRKRRKPPSTVKRMILMLLAMGVLLFLVFGFGAFRSMIIRKVMAKLQNPPQTVATMTAKRTSFQPTLAATGSLVAVQGTNVAAEVPGIVDTISFTSGTDVKQGDVLLTLRPNNDKAVLNQLQATESLDRTTYQRDLAQYRAHAVSKQTVDADHANLLAAEARVAGQKALIAEKVVRAPFAGRIGIRQVDLGQYLAAGTAIATLQQLDPIYADFYLPQAALGKIHAGLKADIGTEAFAGKDFAGKIAAVDSTVSTGTRMIKIRARLGNPGDELRPGMFVHVTVPVGSPTDYVTLPKTAIAYNPYGDTVFVVEKSKQASGATLHAKQVFVTLGETRGDQVAVTKGVQAGEQVVVAGQLKLKNGTPIRIDNSILPPNSPNPSVPLN